MTLQTAQPQLLAITDETNTCECCGKSNLKRVAVIRLASGDIVRYGRDCAARELGRFFVKTIDSKIEQISELAKVELYVAKFAKNYSVKQVEQGVWNKFGYLIETKRGQYVMAIGTIELSKYFEAYQQSVNWWAS